MLTRHTAQEGASTVYMYALGINLRLTELKYQVHPAKSCSDSRHANSSWPFEALSLELLYVAPQPCRACVTIFHQWTNVNLDRVITLARSVGAESLVASWA
jgi:hypothetical protein